MATTRARPTVRVDRYRVRCDEYTQTFQNEARARAQIARIEQAGACLLLHTVDIQPDSEGPWLPIHVHRAQQILAAPVGPTPIDTPDGPLIKSLGGWSAETAARADAAATVGSPKWLSLLGTHEHATLTADGRGRVDGWCECQPRPAMATWVRYERYTAEGRAAHGYLCPTCRRLVQSG